MKALIIPFNKLKSHIYLWSIVIYAMTILLQKKLRLTINNLNYNIN